MYNHAGVESFVKRLFFERSIAFVPYNIFWASYLKMVQRTDSFNAVKTTASQSVLES